MSQSSLPSSPRAEVGCAKSATSCGFLPPGRSWQASVPGPQGQGRIGSARGFPEPGRGGANTRTLSSGLELRPEHAGEPFAGAESASAFE